jgi:RNA polymerase sigma-70 factor (ECF subfamily)
MSDISTKSSISKDIYIELENDERLKSIPEKYRKDYNLVQKIICGNEEAWNYFVTKTQSFIYYTIKKVINKTNLDTNSKKKALELTEDLFLDFYEHLLKSELRLFKRYKGNSKLSSYLYVCLSNFVYDFFKSKKWKSYLKEISATEISSYMIEEDSNVSLSDVVDRISEKTEDNFNPEKELEKKELQKILDELISSLSEKEQLCFHLIFSDGLKPSEASMILGVSSFEVSQIKYRIKEKLKKNGKEKIQEFLDGI